MKETKFVQLGLKRKGRIVKNEQYSIDEFMNKLNVEKNVSFDVRSYSIFELLFYRKRIMSGILYAIRAVQTQRIHNLINNDKFGRKRKKS